MRLTDFVHARARAKGADLFGVCSAEAFDSLEPRTERKASYFLENAQCLVVMGLKLVDAVLDPLEGKADPYSENFRGYLLNYNYNLLDYICVQTGRFLEELGWDAYPVQARVTNRETDSGVLSHKPAAVLAGLGAIGKNGLLITPEFGPRVRLVTLITNAPLVCFSGKMPEPGEVCGSCDLCLGSCPVGAISFDAESRESAIDKVKCRRVMLTNQCALCQAICPLGREAAKRRRRRAK